MQSEITERAKTAWNSIADEFNQWDALGLDEQETYVALTAALAEQTQQGVEEIRRLDDALCNFINAYGDPYEPAEDYEAETERNIKELSDAYNDAHVAGVFSGRAALVDVPAVEPVAHIIEGPNGEDPRVYLTQKYDPRIPDFWLNEEARAKHRVTPLYASPPLSREGEDNAGWTHVQSFHRYPYVVEKIGGEWHLRMHDGQTAGVSRTISKHPTYQSALAATRSGSASEGGDHD